MKIVPKVLASFYALALAGCSSDLAASERSFGGDYSEPPYQPYFDTEDWPGIREGRLGNGLRYVILPRQADETGVAIYMQVEGGFLAEKRPGERGLVHLIEHLAFDGSTNLPSGEFRRIGLPLTHPAPSAGATNWRHSTYYLTSRTGRPEDLDKLLFLFREVASELTFLPETVERQKVDVLREMTEKEHRNRIYADYIRAVAPGSPNDVIDAQNSDDVGSASVATIRALYKDLYRPESTTLTIVGDVDPSEIEPLIKDRFSDWQLSAEQRRSTPKAELDFSSIRPVSVSNAADGRRGVTLSVVSAEPSRKLNREAEMRRVILDDVMIEALKHRFFTVNPLAAKEKLRVTIDDGKQGFRQIMLLLLPEPHEWRAAVTALLNAECSLATQGLSEDEWAFAKAATQNSLAEKADEEASISNIEIAERLTEAVAYDEPAFRPTILSRFGASWLPSVGPRVADGWWQGQWISHARHIRVEAPELSGVELPEKLVNGLVEQHQCPG